MTEYELPPHSHTLRVDQIRAIVRVVERTEADERSVERVTIAELEPPIRHFRNAIAVEFDAWKKPSMEYCDVESLIIDEEGKIVSWRSSAALAESAAEPN